MALYVSDYQFDLGKIQPCLLLKSYLVEIGGKISRTSYDFDSSYLPQVFFDNVAFKTSVKTSCSANFRPRKVLLYLDEFSYLSVQIPFLPTSINYLNFLAQVKANSLIKQVELIGEKISSQYTIVWSNG